MLRVARRTIDLPLSDRIPYPGVYQHIYPTRRNCPAHYRARFVVPVRLYRDGLLPAPEGLEEYYGRGRRCVYLGCYTDPEVAFTAVLMFLLNFVVEFPWTAPDVLTYLRSLDYAARYIPDLESIETARDMYLYACMEVFEMFPVTDDSYLSEGDDVVLTRDLEEAVALAAIAATTTTVYEAAESDDTYLDYLHLEPYILDRSP